MTDGLRNAEPYLRQPGETMLPYMAQLLLGAGLLSYLLLRLRYPHKIKFFPTANSIPDAVFSGTAHNFRGKIVGITTVNGLQVMLAHRPNWNPFCTSKMGWICVQVAGIAQVKDTVEDTLRLKLVGKKASIDLTGRNKEANAVEAWVFIQRSLRKRSLSHLLVNLDMAETRQLPAQGFTYSSVTSSLVEKTLKQQPTWYTRLFRRLIPPKF